MFFNKSHALCMITLLTSIFTQPDQAPTHLYEQITPKLLKNINIEDPSPSETDRLNACRAFHDHGVKYPLAGPENFQAITSVNFFAILEKYFQPHTQSGFIALATQCAQMTDNIETLKIQQARLHYLQNNPSTITKLDEILTQAQSDEQTFFALFTPPNEEGKKALEETSKYLYYAQSRDSWNENATMLELFPRLNQGVAGFYLYATGHYFKNLPSVIRNLRECWCIIPIQAKVTVSSFLAIMGVGLSIGTWFSCQKCHNTLTLTTDKKADLIATGNLLTCMHNMLELLKSDAKLQTHFAQEYQTLTTLFDKKSKRTSRCCKNLVKSLLSYANNKNSNGHTFFSSMGKILATHKKLHRVKGELVPFIEAFGQIDAYLATNKLLKQFKNHPRVKFCIPAFIDATNPVLDIHEYWHPLIDPNTVVTNSLKMDHNCANLIITGPNAGGKTTSLMSLIINIIFAQSFGIAPSSSLFMTPFAKIHSYLDITTNLQEGLSLFAAEVDRAKKLKESILSCKNNEKTFTIIDEIFSGTNPQVASDVGFKFAAQLGGMEHSMTIITTHFPALTELEEQNKNFVNFKVADAIVHTNGSITYPFTLIRGISTQNIAEQMLKNQDLI